MTEDERQSLLEGLKAKWEQVRRVGARAVSGMYTLWIGLRISCKNVQVNTAYQGGTHVTNLVRAPVFSDFLHLSILQPLQPLSGYHGQAEAKGKA